MYQLVIQFPLRGEQPTSDEFDAIASLEQALDGLSGDLFDVDGNDFGSGEMNLYILTDDVARTFDKVKPRLPTDATWRAGFRSVDSDDYSPLAPSGLTSFEVK